MAAADFPGLIARHRNCFLSGRTRPVEWREAQLDALHALMTERAGDFFDALWKDLRRNRVDADATDVKYVADEAAYARHHLRRWMNPLHVSTPLIMAPGRTEIRFDPLGVGLIIGAWNYPIMLSLSPLVAAIAGGNAAVIKPSEVSPACADAIARLVPQYLDTEAFSVVIGGVPETTALLAQEWDHIFFTGAPPIGKVVMAAAAKNLTPVVLELGGKNPTIVHDSADLRVAARRIAQGRWMNAGQTCTAPDHVLVFRSVAADFLAQLKEAVVGFYGAEPQNSPDYGRIVNARHFDRLTHLIGSGEVYHGGQHDRDDLFIAPTILVDVAPDSPVMQEEMFGPILPVLEVDSVDEVIRRVNAQPAPLGLYVFSEDAEVSARILDATRSGDAAVNDCSPRTLLVSSPGSTGRSSSHRTWRCAQRCRKRRDYWIARSSRAMTARKWSRNRNSRRSRQCCRAVRLYWR
jgi:aldehyde dehydrogenase (NAD+)